MHFNGLAQTTHFIFTVSFLGFAIDIFLFNCCFSNFPFLVLIYSKLYFTIASHYSMIQSDSGNHRHKAPLQFIDCWDQQQLTLASYWKHKAALQCSQFLSFATHLLFLSVRRNWMKAFEPVSMQFIDLPPLCCAIEYKLWIKLNQADMFCWPPEWPVATQRREIARQYWAWGRRQVLLKLVWLLRQTVKWTEN